MEVKRKRGRPKKIDVDTSHILKDPHDPTATLRTLGFDPIVKTVQQIREVDKEIRWVKKQSRPSQAAISALHATKRALNSDLLKFGYRPVPEKIIQENHNFSFGIKLTDQDGEVEVQKIITPDDAVIRH